MGLTSRTHKRTDAQTHRRSASQLPLQTKRGSARLRAQALRPLQLCFTHIAQIHGQFQQCAHFRKRSQSDAQGVSELRPAMASLPFGDVRYDRYCSPTKLRDQPKPLLARKVRRQAIDLLRKSPAMLPRQQPPIRVHPANINQPPGGRLSDSLRAVLFLCVCASVRLCVAPPCVRAS